jgi:hypothetical protein
MGGDADADRASERRKVLMQIRPEDRRAVRWWLTEGLTWGEESSREAREALSQHHEEAADMTELLEPLIVGHREIDAIFNILLGMDLEAERRSELNEQD